MDDSIVVNRDRRQLISRDEFSVFNIYESERVLYFFMRGEKAEEIDARTQRIFDNGNDMHERFYRYFSGANILVEKEKVVKKNKPPISGRLDAIIKLLDNNFIVDLKSINTNGFNQIKKNKQGKQEHVVQLQIYMDIENCNNGILLYEDKNGQEIFPVYYKFNREIVDKIYDKLFSVLNYLKIGKTPDRCFGCSEINPFNFCSYKIICRSLSGDKR